MRTHLIGTLITAALLTACGSPEPVVGVGGILEVDEGNLSSTIEDSSGHLLVHFSSYDPNCGPCIDSNTTIDDFARQYGPDLTVARLTWDPWHSIETEAPEIKEKYWIRGLPTMIMYKDGEEQWRGTGITDKNIDKLTDLLEDCCG